jgi:hypothetical protein
MEQNYPLQASCYSAVQRYRVNNTHFLIPILSQAHPLSVCLDLIYIFTYSPIKAKIFAELINIGVVRELQFQILSSISAILFDFCLNFCRSSRPQV